MTIAPTCGEPVSDADYLQLSRLLVEMVWRLDNGCAETVHELFIDDGRLNVGEKPLTGKAALRAWGAEFDKDPPAIHHVLSNARFIATGNDRAIGTSTLTAYMATQDHKGLATVPLAVGVDHDEFVRTADGWRFSCRRWQPLFTR